jgi:hypothetical protein
MYFPFRAMGETALDEWQCLFQRDFRCRCQQQMEVIGDDHKFMQQKAPLSTILRKNIHQKLSHAIGWKMRALSGCRRGHGRRCARRSFISPQAKRRRPDGFRGRASLSAWSEMF